MDKRMDSDLDTIVAVSEFLKRNGFGVDFDYTTLAREYKANVRPAPFFPSSYSSVSPKDIYNITFLFLLFGTGSTRV